ncbi:MAG: nitroreductase family deazaflavin-dependent oxidoreductase [Chloroflexota bacterium]|nr:nitroreductase family deazaflavin-dependent oxidoreductase [Chloroflexota bacterium]
MDTLAREQYCYLTTVGRRTGNPHTIEIWFAMPGDSRSLYMLAGGGERSDWVKNLRQDPSVQVRIGDRVFSGQGRIITEAAEEQLARRLVVSKYYGREEVRTTGWEATSLTVAVDLEL